jgi:xylulokinase
MTRTRYAIVGTGSRATMYIDALCGTYSGHCDLAALCDTSPVRISYHNRRLAERYGRAEVPAYDAGDPEQWWQTTVANVAAVMARNPGARVRAVGVGAQMHSLVAVDASGRSLTARSALWSDKRCLDQVRALLGRPDAGDLCRRAGNRPVPAWAGFKMARLRDCLRAAYDRATRLLVAKDFLNLRLCGEAATDPTEASGTFLCDAASSQWSGPLLAALDVDRAKLPEIAASSSVIGGVRPDVAARTGLTAGTPVVAGSGDMLCQLLGSGITRPGQAGLVAGTASIMAVAAAAAADDARLMNLRSASGGWIRFGISDAAGKAFRWFADEMCQAGTTFDALTAAAARVEPGRAGCCSSPTCSGSGRWATPGPGRPSSAPRSATTGPTSSAPCSRGSPSRIAGLWSACARRASARPSAALAEAPTARCGTRSGLTSSVARCRP